jgi:formylglycine-generating enzyme required for sulfatase activity
VATQAGVKTAEAAEVRATTALLGGTVTASPTDTISAFGIVFANTPTPTLATGTLLPATTAPGSFSLVASGLFPDTLYFARAYATTRSGTDYGADIRFQTAEGVAGFSLIPAGPFQMGDAFAEWSADERPVHTVNVNAFYMAKTEVTKAEWAEVRTWGLSRGYTDLAIGGGKASNHPVQTVSWWDVIKWCNARSEKDGLEPVYTVNGAVMRTGTSVPTANWTARGYRLPTEAEWEKAARGGLNGKRFPWGDTISHSQANYWSDMAYAYDISQTREAHPTYAVGGFPYTSPVRSFAANGYGLHDMAGNVLEWCWDWDRAYAFGTQSDPTGAAWGSDRVSRGGSWGGGASVCRVANRGRFNPSVMGDNFGFRPARGL